MPTFFEEWEGEEKIEKLGVQGHRMVSCSLALLFAKFILNFNLFIVIFASTHRLSKGSVEAF